MMIDKIISKPGLVYQTTIPPSYGYGVSFTVPVNPGLPYIESSVIRTPTPIGGIAAIHEYWKGDIKLTFEFVASVFHRCTLLLCWEPDITVDTPDIEDALSTLRNVTVEVCGNTTVELVIPFLLPELASPNKPNGKVLVYVLNPVVSNGSSDPIWTNVFISSDNCAFMCPRRVKNGATQYVPMSNTPVYRPAYRDWETIILMINKKLAKIS